jgi:hypothetical protein
LCIVGVPGPPLQLPLCALRDLKRQRPSAAEVESHARCFVKPALSYWMPDNHFWREAQAGSARLCL